MTETPEIEQQLAWKSRGGYCCCHYQQRDGVAGVAWNVRILPVRALGKCGGSLSDIAEAIRWAAGLQVPGVPTNPTPAQVINLSLGGGATCGRTLQSAVTDAIATGAVVVAATGNEAPTVVMRLQTAQVSLG